MRKYLSFLLVIISTHAFSQRMSISGNVLDTVAKKPLQYAVAIAVRIKDSTLVAYARTDVNGHFQLKGLPIDTFQVIISNPRFGDQSYYIFGSVANNVFDFGKIVLPPKTQQLNEVVIYAFKDPVYYKGDTLVYAADSFKVRPNATVEDLLKKLPGIKVNAQGKITSQGKEVSQVLVDGDEFFGSDPTVATKNLNANSVESVQVYEKKNENAAEGGDETTKVINLQLKDAAKHGYFGKVSGASDGQKFYEGDILVNKFTNKQKVSVFTLGSNTPRSNFGWSDISKYGLDNEINKETFDDGSMMWSLNENKNTGIPQTFKTGIYYNDKISKKTKIGFNYTYNNNQLEAKTDTRSQYFLTDTSYTTTNSSQSFQKSESHNVNFSIVQTIDSLTELTILPKLTYTLGSNNSQSTTNFLTNNDSLRRATNTENTSKTTAYNLNTSTKLKRNFKNRDRLLLITYNLQLSDNNTDGILKSSDKFYNSSSSDSGYNQEKTSDSKNQTHNALITYTEPVTKKIKLEFEYNYIFNLGNQNKKALDFSNGSYSLQDSLFTNSFQNKRFTNRLGAKFTYEVRKQRFSIGTKVREISATNVNLITQSKITQNVNSILPFLSYMYKFSDNKRLSFQYYTGSNLPTIDQLQPIQDNTNPNQIKVGNPNLLPTYENHFTMYGNSYKAISGKYFWSSLSVTAINNAISNSIIYDSIGRTFTKAVNVNGNYNGNAYIGGSVPFFSKRLTFDPELSLNYSNNNSFVNGQKNLTKTSSANGGADITVLIDTLEFKVGGKYTYNYPVSTISSQNKPYTTQVYNASVGLQLPKKFRLESNVTYTLNSQRTTGYNINYFLWNASLSKRFFKMESLIVSFEATDILNQNINTSRIIQDNVTTDTKTNIISRFFLLRVVYKFNSAKTKDTDEDGF